LDSPARSTKEGGQSFVTSEVDLVHRARRGEAAARAELVRGWSARVLAVCRARVRNLHVAEDLAQETLLRALRGLDTLESADRFGAWLLGIARRVCLDWFKAKQNGQVPLSSFAEGGLELAATDADATERGVDTADEVRRLQREIDALPENDRETLMLYYTHDFTYAELADLLGISPATVNARLTKTRARLRRRLAVAREDRR
jgi:RNA polymerase sigma factor (sigma-70 family)